MGTGKQSQADEVKDGATQEYQKLPARSTASKVLAMDDNPRVRRKAVVVPVAAKPVKPPAVDPARVDAMNAAVAALRSRYPKI